MSVRQEKNLDSPFEQWFALEVSFRTERLITQTLLEKGFESFSPTYPVEKRLRDRVQRTNEVLFPGYVFSRFDPRHRMPIITTPGVRRVVGYGRTPAPIDRAEIDAVLEVAKSRVPVEPCAFSPFPKGSRVRIMRGPLAGVEGVLEENRSGWRVILAVSLIERSIRVQVGQDVLDLADNTPQQHHVASVIR